MATIKIVNEKQETLRRTCRIILERSTQYTEEIKKVPRFDELVVVLRGLNDSITTAIVAKQASLDTKGITAQKNALMAELISDMESLAVLADMIGQEKNQNEWCAKAAKAFRKNTRKLSEDNLVHAAQDFALFLRTVDADTLTKYGIDEDEVQTMMDKVEGISHWGIKKEVALDQKLLDNQSLSKLFEQLEDTKDKMDILSDRFKKIDSPFYLIYQAAKVIPMKVGAKIIRTKKIPETTTPTTTTQDEKQTLVVSQ